MPRTESPCTAEAEAATASATTTPRPAGSAAAKARRTLGRRWGSRGFRPARPISSSMPIATSSAASSAARTAAMRTSSSRGPAAVRPSRCPLRWPATGASVSSRTRSSPGPDAPPWNRCPSGPITVARDNRSFSGSVNRSTTRAGVVASRWAAAGSEETSAACAPAGSPDNPTSAAIRPSTTIDRMLTAIDRIATPPFATPVPEDEYATTQCKSARSHPVRSNADGRARPSPSEIRYCLLRVVGAGCQVLADDGRQARLSTVSREGKDADDDPASPGASPAPLVLGGHRLGDLRRAQPRRHAVPARVADRPVPDHLGQPDGDLWLPDVAAAAHHHDAGRGDPGHRWRDRRAGPPRPGGGRVPGRGPPDRDDVPGDGLARPPAAGDHGREPSAAGAAAPLHPGRLPRAGHPHHRGAWPHPTHRAGRHRPGHRRGRPGGRRRSRSSSSATTRLLLLASAGSPDFLDLAPVEGEPLMVSALNRWTQTPRRWSHRLGAEATVLGDRDRLALALDALIENAVAHTDVDGRIELSTRLEGGAVVLGVADSGCGIPAAELDRIFDQFARVDPHRNRKAGGVGLGLAIVKAIAEAHHGSVRAHSTVGEGSLFEVVLPQSTTRRPAPGPRRRQAGTPPAHRESEPTQPATTPSTQP